MTLPLNRMEEFSSFEDVARFNMVEQQIRPWLVDDPEVIAVLHTLRREQFVPPAYRALAFSDLEIPLLGEQDLRKAPDRCMLAPKVEARFLNDLKIQAHERVLEVGAGTGYMAALLGVMGKEVISLEIHPELAAFARENLQRNNIRNVQVLEMDASRSLPADMFDVIVVSGALSQVPAALLERLNKGGRLIAIVGKEPMMRVTLMQRGEDGNLRTTTPWDYKTAYLSNFPVPSEFEF